MLSGWELGREDYGDRNVTQTRQLRTRQRNPGQNLSALTATKERISQQQQGVTGRRGAAGSLSRERDSHGGEVTTMSHQ